MTVKAVESSSSNTMEYICDIADTKPTNNIPIGAYCYVNQNAVLVAVYMWDGSVWNLI